ncbi:hypothetical protein Tco_1240144, partial [Tanacetum coccineum]
MCYKLLKKGRTFYKPKHIKSGDADGNVPLTSTRFCTFYKQNHMEVATGDDVFEKRIADFAHATRALREGYKRPKWMINFVPGRAMIKATQHKHVKYEATCANIGYGFLPFSFSSFGELEQDAVSLLKRIRKFSVAQDIGARADVHIFNRISFAIARGRSKTDKKFAFVRFIRVDKLERLIENLCTIWIGRLRLHANAVRFQKEPKINVSQPKTNELQPNRTYVGSVKNMGADSKTFASVLNAGRGNPNKAVDSSPAIVLDDECLVERDFSCSLIVKIKDLNTLPNLYLILSNEGFDDAKLTHLGGLWVLLDMDSIATKEKVVMIVGVGSWFNELHQASMTLSYKRLCVKVRSNVTINDMIKVIVKGKIYWIHVKEQETWSPKFIELKDEDSQSGYESDGEEEENGNGNLVNDSQSKNENDLDENDLDHVSESSCMHVNDHEYNHASKFTKHPINSDDPFEIYKILDKNNDKGGLEKNKDNVVSESTDPQFPLCFTPDVGQVNVDEAKSARDSQTKEDLIGTNEDVASVTSGIKGFKTFKSGGSLLDVIYELIKVGHVMGYNMDGCMKNIETIIVSQGDRQ